MPRARLALLVVLAIAALVPTRADAAAPLVTDPKGDAIAVGSSWDILSANLFTTGTTKKVGRRTVYTPTALIATVTLAGPPPTQAGAGVKFRTDISACGNGSIYWSYNPGTKAGDNNAFVSGCGNALVGGGTAANFGENAIVKGNTIIWKLRLKEMGKDLPLGTSFRNPTVTTYINEPYYSLFGTGTAGAMTSFDDARSTNIYELH